MKTKIYEKNSLSKKSTGYSIAGFKGGLEYDIEEYFPEISWIYSECRLNYSKYILRYILNIYYLFKKREDEIILSAGGFIELMVALSYAIFYDCIIFTPGTPSRYYKYIKPLFQLRRKKTKIYTCDILFNKKFKGTLLYNNNPYKERKSTVNENSEEKVYDVLIIGRADENKKFQELINSISEQNNQYLKPVSIAHIGEGGLLCTSEKITLHKFGFMKDRNKIDEVIKQSRVLCISSDYESSPRVFWEATYLGVPVASKNCGNLIFINSVKCQENLTNLANHVLNLIAMDIRHLSILAKTQYDEANGLYYNEKR